MWGDWRGGLSKYKEYRWRKLIINREDWKLKLRNLKLKKNEGWITIRNGIDINDIYLERF